MRRAELEMGKAVHQELYRAAVVQGCGSCEVKEGARSRWLTGGGGAHIVSVAKCSHLVQEERKGSQQSCLCATGPEGVSA